MDLQCRLVVTFPRGATTPEAVSWEGVLEWVDMDVKNQNGYPERVVKVQCALRNGTNGLFLSMPYVRRVSPMTGRMEPVRTPAGKYRNYVDVGAGLQRMGIECVQQALAARTGMESGPTRLPDPGDMREAAKQTFREMAVEDDGIDDPFGPDAFTEMPF